MSISFPTREFTVAEAAALTSLQEKQVRKEFEFKVFTPDPSSKRSLSFVELLYLTLVRGLSLNFPVQVRTNVYQHLREMFKQDKLEDLEVDEELYLRVDRKYKQLLDHIESFQTWKETLVTNSNIMGGETVFPNSRLTVQHIGGMLERDVDAEEILEDYPYLSNQDLDFARIFVRAYPKMGRPRKSV